MQTILNVLIMEDDGNLARLYSRVLRKAGHEVSAATTLSNARILLDTSRFDIFVADLQMGSESGLDLLGEYREKLIAQGTCVIVVSGHDEAQTICEEIGVEHFLSKPVLTYELIHLIDRISQKVIAPLTV